MWRELMSKWIITFNSSALYLFFQAEDGIRDIGVTGVQTCALPICDRGRVGPGEPLPRHAVAGERGLRRPARGRPVSHWPAERAALGAACVRAAFHPVQIGRASCRERV